MAESLLPERSPADILAGIARVHLAGRQYILPALPRRAAREWNEQMDARLSGLIASLESAGASVTALRELLANEPDAVVEQLRRYDRDGVLPEDLEDATNNELLQALLEVWRAANPFVDAALAALAAAPIAGLLSALSNMGHVFGAGPPTGSTSTRPTSGSSPISRSPRTARQRSSASRSKPPASGPSSPRTNGPTDSGATGLTGPLGADPQ